jgi:membrane protein implicated in regulation of membrane protease activity
VSDVSILVGALIIVIGFVMLLADIAHPGLFLLIPAAVLVAAGLILLLAPDVFYTNTVAAVLVIMAAGAGGAVIALPVYSKLAPRHAPLASTIETLTGLTARVVTSVEPNSMKGKVRVRGEVWSATADRTIPEGSDVEIIGGEGIILKVRGLPPKQEK